jgi:hypothetical protein
VAELRSGDFVYDRETRRRGRVVVVRLLLDSVVLQDNEGQWESAAPDVEPISEESTEWNKHTYS